ncbi:MAG: hypothetical protein IT204_15515 [Fimbriimonadaceae bacterium]|nr:hypothetical protein [Fimbriimonadaceae bacterium]
MGGGSRSTLWVSLLASLLGRPLRPLPEVDSALGAALWAAASVGLAVEPSAAESAVCQPDPEAQAQLAAAFERYQQAHVALAGFYASLATRA